MNRTIKQKTFMHQKINSANRILCSRGKMKKPRNQITSKVASQVYRDDNEPVVIYDEDNLIVDEFLTGRQRPQSGRVHRHRPLSGKVGQLNPTHM